MGTPQAGPSPAKSVARAATDSATMDCFTDSLICPVCLGQMRDPVLGTCGHSLCREHAAQLAECPICRERAAFCKPVPCKAMRTLRLAVMQHRSPGHSCSQLRKTLDAGARRKLCARLVLSGDAALGELISQLMMDRTVRSSPIVRLLPGPLVTGSWP